MYLRFHLNKQFTDHGVRSTMDKVEELQHKSITR